MQLYRPHPGRDVMPGHEKDEAMGRGELPIGSGLWVERREPARVDFFRGKLAEISSIVRLDNVSFADETTVDICKHTPCLADYQERVPPASGEES